MNKTFKTFAAGLITAAAFAAGPAAASDNLSVRAVNAIGFAIAAQGDAALAQIRKEFKDTVVERIQPYLPERPAADEKPTDEAATDTTR